MDISTANSISEIDETSWNSLTVNMPFQSHHWYQFVEKVLGEDACPTYVLFKRNGQPAGGASFWLVRDEPIPFDSILGKTVKFVFQHWPPLINRSPLSGTSGLIITDTQPRGDIIREITQIGLRLRREKKASMLFFDSLDPETARTWPGAIPYTYDTPGMVLDITKFRDFDEYMEGLPGKDRRQITHDIRRITDNGITVLRHKQLDPDDLDHAERLYRKLEERKGAERNPWIRQALSNLACIDGTWLTAHLASGELAGCAALFNDNGAQLMTYLGLSTTTQYAYFAMLYEGIRIGLEQGLKFLYWGTGTYAVKERLGFVPIKNDSLAILL